MYKKDRIIKPKDVNESSEEEELNKTVRIFLSKVFCNIPYTTTVTDEVEATNPCCCQTEG
jgi:hypothetical protein